jgi:hypothetical protein
LRLIYLCRFSEILQTLMDQKKYAKAIEICKIHGDKNPKLWTDALALFSDESVLIQGQDIAYLLEEILSNIEESNLLSPLGVIQIMAKNRSATVGMVKVRLHFVY